MSHSLCSLPYDRKFSTECDPLLALSISSILSFYIRASSRCLRPLSRLPVTSILPSIFPSITCFRRQFLHKMWTYLSTEIKMNISRYNTQCTTPDIAHVCCPKSLLETQYGVLRTQMILIPVQPCALHFTFLSIRIFPELVSV